MHCFGEMLYALVFFQGSPLKKSRGPFGARRAWHDDNMFGGLCEEQAETSMCHVRRSSVPRVSILL